LINVERGQPKLNLLYVARLQKDDKLYEVLYPYMKERLLTFCPDYFTAPERYTIQDEESLKTRYADLQLRDTSDLRLDHLCTTSPAIPIKAATGLSH